MYQILDNVLKKPSLKFLYNESLSIHGWHLNRKSQKNEDKGFGGLALSDNYQQSNNSFLYGFNIYLYQQILSNFKSNVLEDQPLPRRIHLGAKYKGNVGSNHRDTDHIDDTTILFFNNPFWEKDWGGGIVIENELIDYVPGRAIIFPSVFFHHVEQIKSDESPIRLATNFIFNYNFKSLKNANI